MLIAPQIKENKALNEQDITILKDFTRSAVRLVVVSGLITAVYHLMFSFNGVRGVSLSLLGVASALAIIIMLVNEIIHICKREED